MWSKVGIWETEEQAIYPSLEPGDPAALLKTPGQDISTGEILPSRLAEVVKEFEGLTFADDPEGGVIKVIQTEVIEAYRLHEIEFEPGDIAIDIGAHVGVVSIYLARKHPGITVLAYEPVPENHARLIENLKANKIANVLAINKAVTGDGQSITLNANLSINSAGSSAFVSLGNGREIKAKGISLASVFLSHLIGRCRLLKIDCEGMEYEILQTTPVDILQRINEIRGEFHINERLKNEGYGPDNLREYLELVGIKVDVNTCRIAE